MMSHEEKQTVNKIADDVAAIKRWWPAIVAVCTLLGMAVTITISAVHYDDRVVKKADIIAISKQITDISTSLKDLSFSFKQYQILDTMDKTNIKKDYNAKIAVTNEAIGSLKKKYESLFISFVTERKNGNKVFFDK